MFLRIDELEAGRLARIEPCLDGRRCTSSMLAERHERVVWRGQPVVRNRKERCVHGLAVRTRDPDEADTRFRIRELDDVRPGRKRDARDLNRATERDIHQLVKVAGLCWARRQTGEKPNSENYGED